MNLFLSIVLLVSTVGQTVANITVQLSNESVDLIVGDRRAVQVVLSQFPPSNGVLEFLYSGAEGTTPTRQQSRTIVSPLQPLNLTEKAKQYSFTLDAVAAGKLIITLNSSAEFLDKSQLDKVDLDVSVKHSTAIDVINQVVGWMYFAAWSLSFYPQTWINFRRKSVVGLNFDFVSLNLLGFFCYSTFNIGLYSIKYFQQIYLNDHPHGVIPVELSDVFFSAHALLLTLVTGLQVLIYDRGGQKVSKVALSLIGLAILVLIVMAVLCGTGVASLTWLSFIYTFSYIKIGVTLVKYIPQALMNYRRKSTAGWSIGNVLLDFTGGILSILQMILLAYNYDDWASIFGNPTKFALGFFSVVFDCLFIVQHYLLYNDSRSDVRQPLLADDSDGRFFTTGQQTTDGGRQKKTSGYATLADPVE